MAGYLHRTATTAYPCCVPTLGEFSRSWSCKTCRRKDRGMEMRNEKCIMKNGKSKNGYKSRLLLKFGRLASELICVMPTNSSARAPNGL